MCFFSKACQDLARVPPCLPLSIFHHQSSRFILSSFSMFSPVQISHLFALVSPSSSFNEVLNSYLNCLWLKLTSFWPASMWLKVISKNHVSNYTLLHLQEFHPSPFANILDSQLRGIIYTACFDLFLLISPNSILIIVGGVSNGTHHGVCGLLSLPRVFPLLGMPHSPPVLQANSNKCAVITHLDATRDAFLVQKN